MTRELDEMVQQSRPLPKPTRIMDHVADRLTEMILEGSLPPGTLIRQEAISKLLGISRTPLREALQRLATEGLVVIGPSGAARVADYDLDEALEFMDLREVIDGLAARTLATRGLSKRDHGILESLAKEMEQSSQLDNKHGFLVQNAQFHVAIIEATHHRALAQNLTLVRVTSQAMYLKHGHQPIRHRQSAIEHFGILEAIASGDGERAEALAREHIRHAADFWLRFGESSNGDHAAPVTAKD